jgi:putative transposase
MPWSDTSPMDERLQFVVDVRRAHESMTSLCARYGISRKTGYQVYARYLREGPAGLLEQSRRPHTSPTATDAAVVAALLALRRRHPTWGGKKLVAILARREPALAPLAPSTAAALLKRHGCIMRPRRQRPLGHPGRPTTTMREPNATWTADFKGQCKTGDGHYCFPLTVADGATRYLLACRALTSVRTSEARPVFERLFRTFGLPERIRSDNGVPFATTALARLSPLSVWWIRLGIRPELIEPGHPEQNGRHERMHKTLKAESTRPPAGTRAAQQRAFDRFRTEFNEERPHEALGQHTPASEYEASARAYSPRLVPLEYPAHCEVRRVSRNGGIRWHNRWVNVSHVLGDEYIAFEEIDDALWQVSFGPIALGRFHEALLRIEDQHGDLARTRRRTAPVLPMSSD